MASSGSARQSALKVAHVMTSANTLVFVTDHIRFLSGVGIAYHVYANFTNARYDVGDSSTYHHVPFARRLLSLGDLLAALTLLRGLRALRPDTIIVSTPKAALFGSLVALTVPSARRILLVRGYRFPTLTGWRHLVVKAMEVLPAFLVHEILASSKESANTMREMLPKVLGKRVGVTLNGSANGIDTQHRFSPDRTDLEPRDALRARFGLESDDTVLLFSGRVCTDKGIGDLLSAFERIQMGRPKVKLLVAGRDDPTDPLPGEIKRRLNSTAIRAGFVDIEDIPALYRAADLLVFPSHREGFGVAAVEAAAMGTPVVASRVGGLQSAVREGVTGEFFDVRDSADLARVVEGLLDDPNRVAKLSASCRPYAVAQFDQSHYDMFWLAKYRSRAKGEV